MDQRYFSEKLAEWYLKHRRNLPWRGTREPYKVWLSEIILQQTRVAQGMPYYNRFIENFPDVFALARASEEAVLRCWQGLGYYSRARNLHRCAQTIVQQYGGVFPDSFKELLKLPGIGPYTAAAVASICYHEPVAVVDGNVFRVISRVFGIDADITSTEGKETFQRMASLLIEGRNPEDHNQALMEFGALWCTPRQPQCDSCVFSHSCFAFQHNMQHLLPVKSKSKVPEKRFFYYFVVRNGNSLLMKKRGNRDIWQGLYDFMLVEKPRAVRSPRMLAENIFSDTQEMVISPPYKHQLSHQTIITRFVILPENASAGAVEDPLEFYSMDQIHDLPKPVLISRFLSDYNFL